MEDGMTSELVRFVLGEYIRHCVEAGKGVYTDTLNKARDLLNGIPFEFTESDLVRSVKAAGYDMGNREIYPVLAAIEGHEKYTKMREVM